MIDSLVLRWILTVSFAVIGGYYLIRCIEADSAPVRRVSCVAHVAMSAAMIAMVWPWGMNIPVEPQVGVFVLAALWFIPLSWSRSARSVRVYDLHHVVIMAAMAWMVGSMPTAMGSTTSDMPPGMDMHGMDMPGMNASTSGSVPGYLSVVSIGLACYFAAYTVWLISRAVAPRMAERTAERSCQGVMSVGMAVMLIAML